MCCADAASKIAGLQQEIYVSFVKAFKTSLLALFLTLGGMKALYAQVIWSTGDSHQVGYELIPSKSYYAAGEQITVRLHGNVDATESGHGMEYLVDFHPGLIIHPIGTEHLPASSWLGIPTDLQINDHLAVESPSLQVCRSDLGLESGNGAIVDVLGTVASNGLNATEVVAQLDGGVLVAVENIDMKASFSPVPLFEMEAQGLRVYPNPAEEWIGFRGQLSASFQVNIYALNGELMMQQFLSYDEEMSVGSLPAGFYLVKVIFRDGTTLETRLKKK